MSNDSNYMDLDNVYNTDLKIKYLLNNESFLINEIFDNLINLDECINDIFGTSLFNISNDIIGNLKRIYQNNLEYEKYVYSKYEEYYNTLKIVQNKFDTIIDK